MAQLYDPGQAILGNAGDVSYGMGSESTPSAPQVEDPKRVRRDDWIQKSDPGYWLQLAKDDPSRVPDTKGSLGYQVTAEEWANNLANANKRLYAADLDRDHDRQRNKQNLAKFAVLAGAAGLATSAMGGAGAGAGTGASQGLTMQIPETLAVGGGATTAGGSLPLLATGAAPAATITGTTAALAPQAIAPLAVGSSTAALPLLPTAAAPAATITGSTAAAGGLSMKQLANAGMQAYSAYDAAKQQGKMAEEAGKPTTKTSTPYGNEFIRQLLPWLFQEMQARYAGRLGRLGVKPTNYSPFAALLAGIPQSYTGVGSVER